MKNLRVLLIFSAAAVLLVSAGPQEYEQEDEGVYSSDYQPRFFRIGSGAMPHSTRVKRQLGDLIGGLTAGGGGDGGGLANLIPGFSEYGPAFMSLINNFLGFIKCCASLKIPDVVTKLIMKCSDDMTNKFFLEAGFLNRSDVEKKNVIFLKSTSLSGFFEAEFCSVKCAFGRMKMLTVEGLPNIPSMKKMLPKLIKDKDALVNPPMLECETMYSDEYKVWKASGKSLTDSDRCWASNAIVECMYRQIIQVCPEADIQAGSLCLEKMGQFFWGEMPKQVGKFFSVLKGLVDVL